MLLKKYTVLRGIWNTIEQTEIFLPNNLKLICDNGMVGEQLHTGHEHYIGVMKKTDEFDIDEYYDNYDSCVSIYDFDDLYIFIINDIKFIHEKPELYNNSKELIDEFDLNNYYIIYYFGDNSKNTCLNFNDLNKKGKIYAISKLIDIKGPYSTTMFTINIKSWLTKKEYYAIELENSVEISKRIENPSHYNNKLKMEICKNAWKLFESVKQEVISKIYTYGNNNQTC